MGGIDFARYERSPVWIVLAWDIIQWALYTPIAVAETSAAISKPITAVKRMMKQCDVRFFGKYVDRDQIAQDLLKRSGSALRNRSGSGMKELPAWQRGDTQMDRDEMSWGN